MQCKMCTKYTQNPMFCSRSCTTSFYNRKVNGRKSGRKKRIFLFCKNCNEPITIRRRKYCELCSKNCLKTRNGLPILSEEITKAQFTTNDTQKYRRIRDHARRTAKTHGLLNSCLVCNYSLWVDCCHKKPIASFPEDTPITVINDPKNLVGLCKNHHWELDNGHLCLPQPLNL